MPFFSIIVPVYRAEDFLDDCVRSILSQSFSDFELLLVDDGSPDGCGALCDKFAKADRRVRAFHQENRGVSAARNLGLLNATGTYILFVDADDHLVPGALAAIREVQGKIGASDFLYWDFCDALPEGMQEQADLRPVPFHDIGYLWAVEHSIGFVWNKLFSREMLERHSVRFPVGMPYMEDNLFVLDYCRALLQEDPCARFLHMPLALYVYQHQNANSITQNHGLAYAQRQYNVVPRLIEAAQEFNCPEHQIDQMYAHYLTSVCYGIYLIASSKELSPRQKRADLHRLFHCPEAEQILQYHAQNRFYSVYYLPFRLRSAALVRFWYWAQTERPAFYSAYINVYPRRLLFSKWRTL